MSHFLLLLAAGITTSSTAHAFILPRATGNAHPIRGGGGSDVVGSSSSISSSSILEGTSTPLQWQGHGPPSRRSKGACHAARLGSLSHAMGKASKRLYNKLRVSVWDKYSLTALRGGRGGLGRAGIPHDEVTFRRRGPDRELTSIPQAERYSSGDWLHNIYNLPGTCARFLPPSIASLPPSTASPRAVYSHLPSLSPVGSQVFSHQKSATHSPPPSLPPSLSQARKSSNESRASSSST